MSTSTDEAAPSSQSPAPKLAPTRLGELSASQWNSAAAAWLGWLFDGLDMHIFTLVADVFVLQLIPGASEAVVHARSSWIQAAFLIGWALGGGFFGRLGDRLGRSRALGLTILTYACFTGLSAVATTWWQLMIFRFLAALGIGGEWAVGSALLAETWPARWRPWAAAGLQTAVNVGVIIAGAVTFLFAGHNPRYVFLVGILPALVVFWIRRHVPEPAEWVAAKTSRAGGQKESEISDLNAPAFSDLFRQPVLGLTIRTIIVCCCSLTAWWAFMFWINQHIRHLPDLAGWDDAQRQRLVSTAFSLLIGVSIVGNFFAALLAKLFGYRTGIVLMFVGFFVAMFGSFIVPRGHVSLLCWIPWVGFFSGVFGLFTMYLPPLFPTLLRTTGAGFCYNIGRLGAAFGTVFFGSFAKVNDFRVALLFNSLLFIPAAIAAFTLPELKDDAAT